MKRTVKYALSAVLATAIVAPAFAQDNFPDVAENHWAYEAIGRLKKDGILVGFPDGKYRGARPATRYELAVAINAAYMKLKDLTEDLDKQIAALSAKLDGKANQSDIDDVKKGLEDLKSQLAGVQGYGQDIADLKKLADKFEKELASIGVDVDELKKNLSDLDKRVTALEGRRLPVDLHGDLNAVAIGGYGTGSTFGITVDGRPTGVGRGSYAGNSVNSSDVVGVNRDLTVLHEVGLELDSTNTTGPKWKVVGAAGNMVGTGTGNGAPFGSTSSTLAGVPFEEGSASTIYFQNFELMLNQKVAGLDFSADLGRVGFKVSPYIFQRPDVTPYFTNDRWDNGEYSIDGGILGFNIGSAKFQVVAGRTSADSTSSGFQFQTLTAGANGQSAFANGVPVGLLGGAVQVDQMLGGTLAVPILGHSSVDLSYLVLDSNEQSVTTNGNANRVVVYGGDLTLKSVLPWGLQVKGGYSRSDVMENGARIITSHNQRATGDITWDHDKWGLKGGYRYIEPNYAAPGDWGRIGLWWNPTDIKGPNAEAYYNFSKTLTLKATGEYYNGTGLSGGSLSTSDKITRYTGDLIYKFMPTANVDLGVEGVDWSLSSSAHPASNGLKPYEHWYTLGVGYDLSSNTMLKVMWQISDYNGKGQAGFNVFGQPTARGGLITTQLSIKF